MNYQERERFDRVVESSRRQIWCTFQRDGVTEKSEHHNFHFRVEIEADSSWEISESKLLRRQIKAWFDNGDISTKGMSLNQVADKIYLKICERFGIREVEIEMAAEGENGLFVKYHFTHSINP